MSKNKAVYRQYRRHGSQTTGEQHSLCEDLVAIRGLLRYKNRPCANRNGLSISEDIQYITPKLLYHLR